MRLHVYDNKVAHISMTKMRFLEAGSIGMCDFTAVYYSRIMLYRSSQGEEQSEARLQAWPGVDRTPDYQNLQDLEEMHQEQDLGARCRRMCVHEGKEVHSMIVRLRLSLHRQVICTGSRPANERARFESSRDLDWH